SARSGTSPPSKRGLVGGARGWILSVAITPVSPTFLIPTATRGCSRSGATARRDRGGSLVRTTQGGRWEFAKGCHMAAARSHDAIVIGAGQGGLPLSMVLARAGLKTAVVEERYLGGSCVNYG